MKNIVLISLLIGLAGCRTTYEEYVPLNAVVLIPHRLDLLKPGMSPHQVMDELGLWRYQLPSVSSGPENRFGYQFFLRPDYSLTLIYDLRSQPPAFLRARLDGIGWNHPVPSRSASNM